jgi:hypothetical protein
MKDVIGEADPFSMVIDLGEGKGSKEIFFDRPEVSPSNAIKDELAALAKAINDKSEPVVTVEEGYNALHVAHQVLEKLKYTSNLIN